jgi:hypothetical protein
MSRVRALLYFSEQQRQRIDSIVREYSYSRCDHVRELLRQECIVISRSVLYRHAQQLRGRDVSPINSADSTILVMIDCRNGEIESRSLPVSIDAVLTAVSRLDKK